MSRRFLVLLSLLAVLALPLHGVLAQDGSPTATPSPAEATSGGSTDLSPEELADLGEVAGPVQAMRPQKNKIVYLIFDVSGSMKGFQMWGRARQAAGNILRYGCRVGDEVGLLTFGAGYDSVVRKIENGDDRQAILDKLPTQVSDGEGTNIRRPHHEALKAIAKAPNRPAYIIVFTDSYNDEPKQTDPAYADYKQYYVPGQLTKHPKTPENQDYERLLEDLVVSGKVKQYGIGVNFAKDGRPIERLPQSAPSPTTAPTATPEVITPVTKPEEKTSPLLWIVGAIAALAVGGGLWYFLGGARAMPLRIVLGPKDFKDFSISNQAVRIGGEGAKFSPDAFPVPELRETVALISVRRGGLVVAPPVVVTAVNTAKTAAPVPAAPAPSAGNGAGSNEKPKVRVLLNGMPLEKEMPAGYGDELRVSITPASGIAKEYRLKFADPKQL